jgi:transposase-like protein
MKSERVQGRRSCPHCASTSVRKNGKNRGKQRWHCPECGKSFGETFGTPLFGLHTPVEEVGKTLLLVMRRGSLRAAEEITGHKYETIGEWLRRAGAHAEALTKVLVKDLELDEVEVDAFWSFVGNATETLRKGQPRHRGWTTRTTRAVQARAGAG